jgi:putative ATP-dependent endonuclease of OLD family
MFLEEINIVGFRGINHLHLVLDDNTLLIGENAWGKSSLLDALALLLSPNGSYYQFNVNDFHRTYPEHQRRQATIKVQFTFCETYAGYSQSDRYRHLSPVWIKNSDGLFRICYSVEGLLNDNGQVTTSHSFLDANGAPLALHNTDKLISEILRLHPVLRLSHRIFNNENTVEPGNNGLAEKMASLAKQLFINNQSLNEDEVEQGIRVMRSLIEDYFSNKKIITIREPRYRYNPSRLDWESLENLNQVLSNPKNREVRGALLGIFATMLQAHSENALDAEAYPLLLIEEPESRLHPIMLSVAWGLLNNLPLQKLTTTNSGELLSLVPIERICKLVREPSRIVAYRLGDNPLSPEDNRRISFHIRFNRASSLFSRCWLLVEGETETWMLSEFARLCGHHFDSEGIKIIEFAQSGLKPLIKFADRMGIEWHVLVDGDEAGKKYANTVRAMTKGIQEKYRLTMLPALDLENFMYREGFKEVYHRVAMVPENVRQPTRRIIQKAVHRSSKPDLAIEVAEQAGRWGVNSVPPLLRSMFNRVIKLARKKAD